MVNPSRVPSLLLMASSALAWQDWCGWVPISLQQEVAGCTEGSNTSFAGKMEGCVEWCEWVPVLGWMYVEECSLCINSTVITNVTSSMKRQPRGLKAKRLDEVFPDWCRWLPSASLKFVGDCAGYGGDQTPVGPQCASWCHWVPQASWFDPPDCRGCQPSGSSDSVSEVEDVPLWCNWVPPLLLQFVDACASGGSSIPAVAEGCTYWCVWVSGPAWHHVHECHRCSNETMQNTSNASNATNGTQEEREDTVLPLHRHGTAGLKVKLADPAPLADPDWCRWVPAASLEHVPDCAGHGDGSGEPWLKPASRRQCENWCQWVPQPAWQCASARSEAEDPVDDLTEHSGRATNLAKTTG
eukprot:s7716_g4.t1